MSRSFPLASPSLARLVALAIVLSAAACGRTGGAAPTTGPVPGTGSTRGTSGLSFDATPLYRQMGLIARGLPFPVLGRAAFLASASPDTTHVVLSFAFASATLAFAREADDRFRADYAVSLVVRRGPDVVARSDAEEQVVVSSYRETTRTEETILFQEILDVPPGEYSLTVSLRDTRSQRTVEERLDLRVPRFADQGFSSPMPIAEAVPRSGRAALPNLLVSPSGTAIVGRDTVIPVYVESYRAADTPLHLVISNERGRVLWDDTVSVVRRDGLRAGIVEVPVRRIGVGAARLTFVTEGDTDSSSAYVFVGFGSELPVATYEEMLSYLRYFASASRLERLRSAPEEERPVAWAEFVAATDGDPQTPEHEDLRDYFGRLMRANSRFREEATPGWLSDRGKVFIALGDPDHIYEPPLNDMQRGRQQMWEYRARNLQLVFYDQTGAGRWRLTQASEVRFETEFRRTLR